MNRLFLGGDMVTSTNCVGVVSLLVLCADLNGRDKKSGNYKEKLPLDFWLANEHELGDEKWR